MESHGITILLRVGEISLHSFVLDKSADGYGATEIATNNKVANAQVCHRRLGYLNELLKRRDGNGATFDRPLADWYVFAMEKCHQLAHPRQTKNADFKAPFQLVTDI